MVKITLRLRAPQVFKDISQYFVFLRWYLRSRVYKWFVHFEVFKDVLVDLLYKKRGKYVRPFLHFGTIALIFFAITVGPVIFASNGEQQEASSNVLTSSAYGSDFLTKQAEEVRQFRGGEIISHTVGEGETISSIATLYGLQQDTIIWENNLTAKSKIKPGDELRILPIDGVRHKVTRGETIYSIGKKYKLDGAQVQVIVDYPFNEFLNDETFELATGQYVMVPDGVKATVTASPVTRTVYTTPDAGAVTASGAFVWPAAGRITQGYRFYHKAWDIASGGGGPILAADAGTVVASGWDPSGYGNKIVIDHGNGYVTLYGHMSVLQVQIGQRVNRGDVVGQMGSTGRSTGVHLHFEIRQGSVLLDPGIFLK
ncbi:M23 family metallopeptidase [Candidatus Woesebacteria bacterium]|nr:M23 family metallopeptidase [Candidatus Woesebacteria bacterium]